MYIWLSLPIRWAEWKSVMLSPPDSQLEGGREGRLERRLETPVWDGGVATWGWAEWKIVMPVAVGELERGTLQQHLGDAVDGLCCWDTMSAEVLVHDYQGASKSQWFVPNFWWYVKKKKMIFLGVDNGAYGMNQSAHTWIPLENRLGRVFWAPIKVPIWQWPGYWWRGAVCAASAPELMEFLGISQFGRAGLHQIQLTHSIIAIVTNSQGLCSIMYTHNKFYQPNFFSGCAQKQRWLPLCHVLWIWFELSDRTCSFIICPYHYVYWSLSIFMLK